MGCTQLMRADLCVCALQHDRGFTHRQRGNAAIVLLERQYMERVGAHDSLISFPMNVLSPLSASVGLNYLSYMRGKKNAKGYKDNQNGESLA